MSLAKAFFLNGGPIYIYINNLCPLSVFASVSKVHLRISSQRLCSIVFAVKFIILPQLLEFLDAIRLFPVYLARFKDLMGQLLIVFL